MRINVYNEELLPGDSVDFVDTFVEATGKTYYGLRIYLKSAPELHATPTDDDRSAITFWFGTKEKAAKWLEKWLNRVKTI